MKVEPKIKQLASTLAVLASLQAVSIALIAEPANAFDDRDLADDTLLLLLADHTKLEKVSADLKIDAQADVIEDIHVQSDDYSILSLQGPVGQREVTLAKIETMMQQHPEYVAVTRNYLQHEAQGSMPNDPNFSQQWPLTSMNWPAAWASYNGQQKHSAHITILTGGCDPVSTNNELGAYITEYDTTKKPVRRESLHTNSTEGDIDCSISSCLTDNSTLIAGAGCFTPSYPCVVTLLRIISNGSHGASNRNIHRAIAWAIDHKKERGGDGPLSLSYGGSASSHPFFNDKLIRRLATSLVKHRDILVMAAGDKSAIQTAVTDTGDAVVVQASSKDNTFDSHHTLIRNDPAAAPGAAQPAVIKGAYNASHDGSSFSTPLWSSAIAMVIAFNPSLTAPQANNIILNTGTVVGTISGATWHAVIPNFRAAISSALSMPDKKHH
jgi:hypothetical protein